MNTSTKNEITVIITCHNEAKYIKECFNSVVIQSCYENIKEIIIIDDGSTDNSPQILNQLKLDCVKLKVIRTIGVGLASARNIGIKSSNSEFIAFLDGDDFWTEDKLQNQIKAFKKDKMIGLVYGDYFDFIEFNISQASAIYVRSLNNFDKNQLMEYFVKDAPIIPSTTIVRKEVFKTVGLFNEEIKSEDTEMYLRIAEKWKFFYVAGVNLYKRKREGQLTERLENFFKDQKIVSEIAISRNPYLKKYSKKRESFRSVKVGIDCLTRHNEKLKTFKYAINALKLNLFNLRAWALIIMLFFPYNISIKMYDLTKNIFYQLRKKNLKY
jgi:glycosyltransferase involved in cell wall biosynthesis